MRQYGTVWDSMGQYKTVLDSIRQYIGYLSISAISILCFVLILEELLDLHRGQGRDIFWRDSYMCPREEEYREMVCQSQSIDWLLCHFVMIEFVLETGGLFRLAVDLMQLFSDNKRFLVLWIIYALFLAGMHEMSII